MRIKSKPKTKIQKSKRSRTSKPGCPLSSKDKKIISRFEREIIKDLYKFASKRKSKGEITLAEVGEPKTYGAKIEILKKLKKQKLVKKYKLLKPVEIEFQPSKPRKPSELEIELNPEVLLQQPPQDYDHFLPLNASIEFNSKKVIACYEKNYRREIAEEGFRKEQVLVCGGLRFGLESGYAIYGKTVTNFMPDGQEYNLLRALMKKPNQRLSYDQINKVLDPKNKKAAKKDRRDISLIIRNIKRKLEITGPRGKNKDLFQAHNGYRVVCNKTNP